MQHDDHATTVLRRCAWARTIGLVGTVALAMGAGCAAPAEQPPAPEPPSESVGSVAQDLTLTDLFGDFSTAMSVASAANSLLAYYGVNLFGPVQPTNQQLLDQINQVSSQISALSHKVDVVLADLQVLQISLQVVSNQVVQTSVDQRLADMDGALAGMQTYMFELANGQPTNSAVPALLSDQTAADAAFFELPQYYQQLTANGSTTFTPLFAAPGFVKAVTLRTMFLASFFPTNFRQIPGVVTELKGHAAFSDDLANKTAQWGIANCKVTTKYVCASGHYETEIINGKPHRFFECDVENDSYTATCPGIPSSTRAGYPSEGAADAAGRAKLTTMYPAMNAAIGVDGMHQLAANLRVMAGP